MPGKCPVKNPLKKPDRDRLTYRNGRWSRYDGDTLNRHGELGCNHNIRRHKMLNRCDELTESPGHCEETHDRRTMLALLKLFRDICLLRAAPQELPFSRFLMLLSIVCYGLVGLGVSVGGTSGVRVITTGVGLVSPF